MNTRYHHPPELLQLLIETIPRLCKSKRDVLIFLRGAGVDQSIIADLQSKLVTDRDSLNKFDIVRTVLTRLNESGDASLRTRREILRRVVEFEDFTVCWPNDRLEAQGLVANIRNVVNQKDAFTRMYQEREYEVRKNAEVQRRKAAAINQRRENLQVIQKDFNRLFAMDDPHIRGRLLEDVLNRMFSEYDILVRDGVRRKGKSGQGIVEQIDGVIELDGVIYLVEMKWLAEPVGVGEVSQHLVRVYGRSAGGGIFISYSPYTDAAISTCRDALSNLVVVLCTLDEFVTMLDRDIALKDILKMKIQGAVIDKQPYTPFRWDT